MKSAELRNELKSKRRTAHVPSPAVPTTLGRGVDGSALGERATAVIVALQLEASEYHAEQCGDDAFGSEDEGSSTRQTTIHF